MSIVIAGTDERFCLLKDMLSESGMHAEMAEDDESYRKADTLITKYPFSEDVRDKLACLQRGARLIVLDGAKVNDAELKDFRVYPLSDDSVFVNENAVLTAEGALCRAMTDADFALTGERVMVIGYGRIGRALTEMLVGLRSVVYVASRRETGRLQAMARGAYALSTESMTEQFPDVKVIFVTSPERMLDQERLSKIPKSAFVYDLSSHPFGVDHEAAREMGLNVNKLPGVPGKYCPLSAARSMYRAVLRIWKGGYAV